MRLEIENGKIEYDGEVIVNEINLQVTNNSKIAIIGKNGCGKTSLFKVLEGEKDLTFDVGDKSGHFIKSNDFTLGYLKQITFSNRDLTLEEEILSCYQEIVNLQKRLRVLEEKLLSDHHQKLIDEYSLVRERLENMGGYSYQKEYHLILKKFGFSDDDLTKKIKDFSGGERTKLAFIKLLINKPDLLLLDEPTNHLDIEAVEWLEDYLANYKKAFIIVSHDREFINKVAKTIYEIENKRMTKYTGNYDDYLKQKETNFKSLSKQYVRQQKEIKHQEELIRRFRYKADKAKMIQSRIKMLDKMEIIENPRPESKKTFKMDINPTSQSGKDVLTIKDLEIGYDEPLAKLSLSVTKGDRIGIIGPNGTGKSTFLRTIFGELEALGGEYKYGFNVKKGYFDQQTANQINERTILEDYKDTYPFLYDKELRNDLGAFLFTGNDVNKKLSVLSGGEIVRYNLCKLLKKKPNLLILDEPTNHMDIYSKEAIERMLDGYNGTLIFVSHDRYFVRKIAKSVLAFEDSGVDFYEYGYNEYIAKKNNKKFEVVEVKKKPGAIYSKSNRQELKKELTSLEKEIQIKEDRVKAIEAEFEKEEVYSDYLLMQEYEQEREDLDDELHVLTRKWEEVMKLLEEYPS